MDFACISAESGTPYFRRKDAIRAAFKDNRPNPFDEDRWAFADDFMCKDSYRRFIHVDLAKNRDAAGIAMCHAPKFVDVERVNLQSMERTTERAPHIVVDFMGRLKAPAGGEIIFSDVRQLIYELVEKRGFRIALVTFDRWQSVDIIQQLQAYGLNVGLLSVDRTATYPVLDYSKDGNIRKESSSGRYTICYETLKEALYDGRVSVPVHPYWEKELSTAQRVISLGTRGVERVEKPRGGSDDLLQAVAGCVFMLTVNEKEYVEIEPSKEEKAAMVKEKEIYDTLGYSEIGNDGKGVEDWEIDALDNPDLAAIDDELDDRPSSIHDVW